MSIGDDTHVYVHNLPHLQKLGKTYFVSVATKDRRVLTPSARDVVMSCCVYDHFRAYYLHCALCMPDHVHIIFTPYEQFTVPLIMSRIKSTSAHKIGGKVWERDYFDRILRSDEDLRKKCEYVCQNPVRARLVENVTIGPGCGAAGSKVSPWRAAASAARRSHSS